MLIKKMILVLNIVFLSILALFIKYFAAFFFESGYKLGIASFLQYYTGIINEAFLGLLAFNLLLYFLYWTLQAVVLNKPTLSIKIRASISGSIALILVFIGTNTLVMGRPNWSSIPYLITLGISFFLGFVLPYSERFIKEMIIKENL